MSPVAVKVEVHQQVRVFITYRAFTNHTSDQMFLHHDGYLSRVAVCDWSSFLCSIRRHSPDTGRPSIPGHKHSLRLPNVCPHPRSGPDLHTLLQDLTDTLHTHTTISTETV